MNSTEAIREIAEKHFPCVGTRNDREYRKMEQDALVSSITALISEHYYPKEFTEWVSGTGWQYHMKFKIWTLGMTADKMVKATTDELYEVWKENER
jgi:hypothetical protein